LFDFGRHREDEKRDGWTDPGTVNGESGYVKRGRFTGKLGTEGTNVVQ